MEAEKLALLKSMKERQGEFFAQFLNRNQDRSPLQYERPGFLETEHLVPNRN